MNARALQALGVATALKGKITANQVASVLRAAASAEAPAVRAAEVARGLERGRPEGGLPHAVERCINVIGGSD